MSVEDAERFANDLVSNKEMLGEVKQRAAGLKSIVEIAKQNGYDFTVDEAKEYMQSRSPRQLTDKQLDAVAGGKHGGTATTSTTVQTTAVATSAAEAAEVATSAVQVAEAAADVAAAAEVVAVVAAVFT